MSKEHPFILYAGSIEFGQTLLAAAEARGWYLMLARDELEALALYTVYYPDATVIDPDVNFADEVEFHLRSIDAEFILVIQPALSDDANPEAILDTIAALFSESLSVQERGYAWITGSLSI